MSTKTSRAERNLKFETLQLHVGQENPDPVTDARAAVSYTHLPLLLYWLQVMLPVRSFPLPVLLPYCWLQLQHHSQRS